MTEAIPPALNCHPATDIAMSDASKSRLQRWPPRLIFDDDTGHLMVCPSPITPEAAARPVTELADTQVDLFSQCLHSNSVGWIINELDPRCRGGLLDTELPPEFLSSISDKLRRGIDQRFPFIRDIEDLKALGVDYLGLLTDEAHRLGKWFFAAVRMNDAHVNDEERFWYGRSRFKREHPELLLGAGTSCGAYPDWRFDWSFNHARPEVGDYFCDIIETTVLNYDVDGIELDFGRASPFFKDGEIIQNIPTMTDLVRRVRGLLDRIGARTGRKLRLMARSGPSVGRGLEVGLDVAAWIREGLVDVLVAMSPGYLYSEADVRGHVELAAGTDVLIYGGIEPATYGQCIEGVDERMDMCRAVAANAYAEGARGMYLFNYRQHRTDRAGQYLPQELEGLCQFGDPTTLQGRNKTFFATGGAWKAQTELPHQLPRKLGIAGRFSDSRHCVLLKVADDLETQRAAGALRRVQLRVRLQDLGEARSRVRCEVNGRPLDFARFRQVGREVYACDNPPVRQGDNSVLFLLDGIVAPDPWPVLSLVEIAVAYDSTQEAQATD